jgi:hypothetical protein
MDETNVYNEICKCPICGTLLKDNLIDSTEYDNQLTELIADKLLNAIENKQPNFGSPKLNRIVVLAANPIFIIKPDKTIEVVKHKQGA